MPDGKDSWKSRNASSSRECSSTSSSLNMETSQLSRDTSITKSKDSWPTTDWLKAIWKVWTKRSASKLISRRNSKTSWTKCGARDHSLLIPRSPGRQVRHQEFRGDCQPQPYRIWIRKISERVKQEVMQLPRELNLHMEDPEHLKPVSYSTLFELIFLF